MFFRFLILFTTIPLLEIWLLLEISSRIGVLDTIALVLVTGIAGAWLAKSQGFLLWHNIQLELQQGRMPSDSLIEGLLLLVGGVVLLTPGLITDIAGLVLLVPTSRKWVRDLLKKYFSNRFQIQPMHYDPNHMG